MRGGSGSGTLCLGDLATKESSPAVKYFLVQAVSDENKSTLQRRGDGEQQAENVVDDNSLVCGEQRSQETEYPRQTDSNEDGNQHTELLRVLARALFRLGRLRQSTVNFRRYEEEEQEVGRQDK